MTDNIGVTIQISDLTLIIYAYNLIALGIIVKWLLPEIRRWQQNI
jgi:uncharacterized membrane protein YqjE